MKKIGFVDYYISEWHANNYPEWIKNAAQKLGAEYEVAYAWAELDLSPVYNETTDEWCAKMGVEKCETIAELCEKSDFIIVLAPSNPEKHLGYAKEVLKYGKRTYIDKTFAPDLATAQEIFDIAKKYNTPFFSSSALRFASELDDKTDSLAIMTTGGGGNMPEYIIHQAEMVVKCLGVGATSVDAYQVGGRMTFNVNYVDGRSAQMTYADGMPFTALVTNKQGGSTYDMIQSDFFAVLIEEIVKFFEGGQVCFDTAQTLEVMKIREWCVNKLN